MVGLPGIDLKNIIVLGLTGWPEALMVLKYSDKRPPSIDGDNNNNDDACSQYGTSKHCEDLHEP